MPRPSRYKPACADQARIAYRLGACDADVADLLGIDPATLYRWRHRHPDFAAAAIIGKEASDDRVELSLYQRAIGFEYLAERAFLPANTTAPVIARYKRRVLAHPGAALHWLRLRRPEKWRADHDRDESGDLLEHLEKALRRVAANHAGDAQG